MLWTLQVFVDLLIFVILLLIWRKLYVQQQELKQSLQEKHKEAMAGLTQISLEIQNSVNLTSLGFNLPVFTGGWALDSHLARYLVMDLIKRQPKTIVELGSGTSTLVIAKVLKELKEQDVTHIVVDHDAEYLEVTRKLIEANGLGDLPQLCLCPLTKLGLTDRLWYQGVPEMLVGMKVDLLLIDGPIGELQKDSRQPAIPILFEFLNKDSLIILDDANRPDEKAAVDSWCNDFKLKTLMREKAGHGFVVLSKYE